MSLLINKALKNRTNYCRRHATTCFAKHVTHHPPKTRKNIQHFTETGTQPKRQKNSTLTKSRNLQPAQPNPITTPTQILSLSTMKHFKPKTDTNCQPQTLERYLVANHSKTIPIQPSSYHADQNPRQTKQVRALQLASQNLSPTFPSRREVCERLDMPAAS